MKHLQSFRLFEAQTSNYLKVYTVNHYLGQNQFITLAKSLESAKKTILSRLLKDFDAKNENLLDVLKNHLGNHTYSHQETKELMNEFFLNGGKMDNLEKTFFVIDNSKQELADEFSVIYENLSQNFNLWVNDLKETPEETLSLLKNILADKNFSSSDPFCVDFLNYINAQLQLDPVYLPPSPNNKILLWLAQAWKDMPNDFRSKIKIPEDYGDEFDLFSGFDELGLF